jgi:uncharacterized protein (PEP-CTERM system associated)
VACSRRAGDATRAARCAIYQYTRDYLRYPGDRTFIVEVGRAIGSYRVRPDLTVSVRGGYEWAIFPESSSDGAIYGAGIAWQPTPRTDVSGFWEERFFGPSWQATATHRLPWLVDQRILVPPGFHRASAAPGDAAGPLGRVSLLSIRS